MSHRDTVVFDLIQQELERQQEGIELIASENFVSQQVMDAMGSVLTNKYAEGLPNKRYYGGCQIVDQIEQLAIDRLKQLFGVQWAMFAIDVAMLLVFVAMVWKAPRSWPVWACALQLLVVTSHVMVMLNLRTPISAFYTVVNMTGYGIMLAIAIGTFWAWQERRAIGADAD